MWNHGGTTCRRSGEIRSLLKTWASAVGPENPFMMELPDPGIESVVLLYRE
jgi:hypothetical protein